MSRFKTLRWGRFLVPFIALAAVVALSGGAALADSSCRMVYGRFTLTPVTGPDCASPVGVCADGSYIGSILATSEFVGSSIIPTADTPTTSVVLLTGDNSFTLRDGTLITKDAITLKTTGQGEFAEVDVIVGGTGAWAGATGTLTGQGTFTLENGGEGSYTGTVCFP
ncbi:MAG TPA: hypothetical protein VFR15_16235 [Chloroflexia bacterium]|nr:hypothetical protein [Chloroflexia bacterium]